MKNLKKMRMTQKEYGDTCSRNSIPHRHNTSPQQGYSSIAGIQRSDRMTVQTGEVPNGGKSGGLSWIRALGSTLNIGHLIFLMAYGSLGLSSRDEDDYSSIFVYGGSIITSLSYFVLYCADINKLTSSIFKRGQGESKGTLWAKAGLMGIVLPVFNFIGLIVMSKKVGQNRKTFWSGVLAFILYLLGNTLLLLKKGKSESEEHELRDNNPPANNSTADNAVMDNSPAANLSVDNSPVDNSTADNAVVDNSPAANSPAANSSVDNSPTVDAPAINSLIDNSSVDYAPANNSLRPSVCTFP